MKVIIFKEIRECSVICLLMLIGLGSVMAGVIYWSAPDATPLVSAAFHATTAFGYPAMGVWLGLTQIMVDRRRGRWDFVTHRPMSRTRIFFAKIIAGLAVYVFTGIVPLAAAALWVVTPGHFAAPFDGQMILPRAADLFSGVVWYFAGMLVAGRRARWVGSRLMPQVLAVLISVFAVTLPMNPLEAVAVFVMGLAILVPAAWGAFVFGGEYETQPLPIRFLQGVSIAPGVAIAFMTAMGLLVGTAEIILPYHSAPLTGLYQVDRNGRILQSKFGPDGREVFTDLNGTRLSEAQVRELRNNRVASGYLSLRDNELEEMPLFIRGAFGGFQSNESYSLDLGNGSSAYWFYVPNRRTIEGYDDRTRRYIGSIGPDGFAGPSSPPQEFLEPMRKPERYSSIIYSGTTAYELDLEKREIQKIYSAGQDGPILDAESFYDTDATNRAMRVEFGVNALVRTPSTIYVFQNGHELMHVPLEHGYPPYNSLTVYHINGGRFIFQYTFGYLPNGSMEGDWVVEADEHGKILNRQQLPSVAWESGIKSDPWWDQTAGVLALPPVIALSPERVRHSPVVVVGLVATGLASAIVAVLLLRRCAPKPGMKIVWAIIGAAMGISGVLLLLCIRQRVASIKCPSCGKSRLVTEEHCEHCQAEFAPPVMLGIEIFELV